MESVRVPLVAPAVRWLAVAAVATGILVASLVPSPGGPPPTGPLGVGFDKYLHAGAYAVLALALAYALAGRDPAAAAAVAVTAAVGFGLAVELLQAPLSTRAFSLLDLAADAVGALLAGVTWLAVASRVGPPRVDPTASGATDSSGSGTADEQRQG